MNNRNSQLIVPLIAKMYRHCSTYKGGCHMGYRLSMKARELKQGVWYKDLVTYGKRVYLKAEHPRSGTDFYGVVAFLPVVADPKLEMLTGLYETECSPFKISGGGVGVYVPCTYLRKSVGTLPLGHWYGSAQPFVKEGVFSGFLGVRVFSTETPSPADNINKEY